MGIVTYSVSFLLKLLLWVFVPVLIIVVIASILLRNYSKKLKAGDKNEYKIDLYSSILAILIVGALLAIVIGFSITFTSNLKERNLVENNKILYYFILITPLIPFTGIIYYIRKIVQSLSLRKNTKTEKNLSNEDIEVL